MKAIEERAFELQTALELIGTDCVSYLGASTCVTYGRSPYAKYGAGRWCDQCIARTALQGGEFPPRGSDPNIVELARTA